MAISEKLIDKRVVARNIKKGMVSSDDYQQFLSELPDRADNIFKLEDAEQETAADSQPDDALSDIQNIAPAEVHATSPEPYQPVIEPPATPVDEQSTSMQDLQREPAAPAPSSEPSQPASHQPESQSDPYKPPFE